MSKLDEILWSASNWRPGESLSEDTHIAGIKQQVKKLILDQFKEAEYDPWKFVEKVEEL